MNQPLRVPASPAKVIRLERCENCKWSVRHGMVRECHLNPPQIIVLPGPRPGTISPQSFFPRVDDTQFCGSHKPKVEGVN